VCAGIGATAFPSDVAASASAFRALASFVRRSREFKEGTTERSESIISNSDYMAGSVNALAQNGNNKWGGNFLLYKLGPIFQ
jgi:hypothetical protein